MENESTANRETSTRTEIAAQRAHVTSPATRSHPAAALPARAPERESDPTPEPSDEFRTTLGGGVRGDGPVAPSLQPRRERRDRAAAARVASGRAESADRVTSSGDTSGTGISSGGASHGDTTHGDTTHRDTTRRDTTRRDTARGDTTRSDTARGHTARGDAARGDAARGDAAPGDTERGDSAAGAPRPALFLAGDTARGESTPPAWRPWLAGGSSREVLARIVHEDPLGIRDHVARALREGAFLLDGDRVLLRSFALVARQAVKYRGRPEILEWLDSLVREAIAMIVREDSEAERRPVIPGCEPGREHGAAFAALSKPLGLEPEAMGRACLAFNRLPHADRAAFFALVIAGRTLDELARASGESATEIARRARRALDAILAGAVPTGASLTKPPGVALQDRGASPPDLGSSKAKAAKLAAARVAANRARDGSSAERAGPGHLRDGRAGEETT